MAAPGQGNSKKARARRNRRARTTTTTTTISQPAVQTVRTRRTRARRNRRSDSASANPYLETLLYPESCKGCKIPDPNTMTKTGTYQTYITDFIVANSAGLCGMWWTPTYSGGWQQSLNGTSSTYGSLVWNSGGILPGANVSGAYYGYARVVSACVMVTYTGNSGTDRGSITATQRRVDEEEQGSTASSNLSPQSYGNLMSDSQSETFPVRNGIKYIYKPTDNSDLEFKSTSTQTKHTGNSFGFVAAGMTPGETLQYTIVINWEGIPQPIADNFIGTSEPDNRSKLGETARKIVQGVDQGWALFGDASSKEAQNINMAKAAARQNSGKRQSDWGINDSLNTIANLKRAYDAMRPFIS